MIHNRRRLLASLMALPAMGLASGCSLGGDSPLRVASHVWPGYELMFLAQREGWIDAKLVELVETRSATESMHALVDGRVEAAALTLDEALRVLSQGTSLKIPLVFNISAGADMVLAKPGIQAPQALAGKRIGVEDTAVGALMLRHLLDAAGLAADAVQVVPLTIDAHLAAWEADELDALITYEPVGGELMRRGAVRIFDSSAIPDTIFDVLAVRAEAIGDRSRRTALESLIAGHFRALTHLRNNPADAGHRLARRLGGSGEAALETYRGLVLPDAYANRRLLHRDAGGVMLAARALSALLVRKQAIPTPPSIDDLVDDRFLPRGTR